MTRTTNARIARFMLRFYSATGIAVMALFHPVNSAAPQQTPGARG